MAGDPPSPPRVAFPSFFLSFFLSVCLSVCLSVSTLCTPYSPGSCTETVRSTGDSIILPVPVPCGTDTTSPQSPGLHSQDMPYSPRKGSEMPSDEPMGRPRSRPSCHRGRVQTKQQYFQLSSQARCGSPRPITAIRFFSFPTALDGPDYWQASWTV
ncbi:hypothetical protein BO70DRAFT_36473 [Aspergillus heteromorphus CBS 117.55]|uniref:Uncharacterized protein n=1 Tax=Aspergillus heteromorphus CBS 117.55 TaxID=1448321 RepID=A0A317WB05_9EURO|nr:uncharacterized protein BO70DRAFT_36473 [Aspergillus heteromorphus CBS 117.55]PWY82198.1 hypothetical protein BO70DRAFT_36473 [Aspergillus heteromorphus CBS 117.55]